MLVTCYLVSAALFYVYAAKRAPVNDEFELAHAVQPAPCEVIELFPHPAVQDASRAA